MFESIGVGDENATAYGATLTWIIKGNLQSYFLQSFSIPYSFLNPIFRKDGTGMIGRILFAFYKGSSLDSDSKMWRLKFLSLSLLLS